MKKKKLPVVGVRPCNGCTTCCAVLGVRPLNKNPFEPCPHVVPAGCGVYGTSTRPKICGEFYCLWQNHVGNEEDRPDRLGAIFAQTNGPTEFTGQYEVMVYEAVPGAMSNPRVIELAKQFEARGILVIGHVFGGKQFRFLGPPAKVALALAWVEASNMNPTR